MTARINPMHYSDVVMEYLDGWSLVSLDWEEASPPSSPLHNYLSTVTIITAERQMAAANLIWIMPSFFAGTHVQANDTFSGEKYTLQFPKSVLVLVNCKES